jgi:hypothetical protein
MTISPDPSDRIFAGQPVQPRPVPQAPPEGLRAYAENPQGPPKAFSTQSPATIQAALPTPSGGPSIDTLVSQVGMSQDSLAQIRNQLNTNNLAFKRSQQHLLRNKFQDATTDMRAANAKMGAETPQAPPMAGMRPIERFLSYVTDGENQMQAAQDKLAEISKQGEQLRPADMILVQIKLAQAQQELEYSSGFLAKVIDSLKTVLSTQL